MTVAFFLNFKFVFSGGYGTIQSQIWKFVAVNLLAALQVWGIAVALEYWLLPQLNVIAFREEIAHGVGICFPIFTSYFAHKLWTFR